MFDATRKRPATHHPGLHPDRLSPNPAQQNRDLSQRSKLVLVVRSHHKSFRIVEIIFPGCVGQSLAVQVKLVGFINQLESPSICSLFSESEPDRGIGGLKEIIQRSSSTISGLAQSTCPTDAFQPNRIRFRNRIFPKEISHAL